MQTKTEKRIELVFNKLKNKLEMCTHISHEDVYHLIMNMKCMNNLDNEIRHKIIFHALQDICFLGIAKIQKRKKAPYLISLVHDENVYEPAMRMR